MGLSPSLVLTSAETGTRLAKATIQGKYGSWTVLDVSALAGVESWRPLFSAICTLLYRPPKFRAKALFIDMDSTLIKEESLDELARRRGCYDEVARLTTEAMAGKFSFAEAFRQRMALLGGMSLGEVEQVAAGLQFNCGALELVAACGRSGVRVYLVTGAMMPVAQVVARRAGIREVYANTLVLRAGKLSGELAGDLVDGVAKGRFVRGVMAQHGLNRNEIIALGDGANDRYMLQEAGVAIGFNPKEVLYAYSNGVISCGDLGLVQWLLTR